MYSNLWIRSVSFVKNCLRSSLHSKSSCINFGHAKIQMRAKRIVLFLFIIIIFPLPQLFHYQNVKNSLSVQEHLLCRLPEKGTFLLCSFCDFLFSHCHSYKLGFHQIVNFSNTIFTNSYLLEVQKKPAFLKWYFGYLVPKGLRTNRTF